MFFHLTLSGPPRTKKNSARILQAGGRRFVAPSAAFAEYQAQCLRQLWALPEPLPARISTPVNLRCVYYMPTRRRVEYDKGNPRAEITITALEDDLHE